MKAKLAEDGKVTTTDRRLLMENGHPGVEVDEAAIRRGENPYTKYYQQQGEHPLPTGTQVRTFFDAVGLRLTITAAPTSPLPVDIMLGSQEHSTTLKEILQLSFGCSTSGEHQSWGLENSRVWVGGIVDYHVHVELSWPSLMYHTVHIVCDFPDDHKERL